MFVIEKDYHLESARRLPRLPEGHPCRRVHGHSFGVTLVVEGALDPAMEWVLDYAVIDGAWEKVRAQIDHCYLNDVPGLENPTSEVLAVWIFERLQSDLPGLVEVAIAEEGTARCRYRPRR
jgi:6-pyruvoyltetrahydropterin/6-carboxytetrahydropterin synthase